jgi:DNA modification methylase
MPHPSEARSPDDGAERAAFLPYGSSRLAALNHAAGVPYFSNDRASLHVGDALDVLPQLPASSVDAVITDPPYIVGGASTMRTRTWGDTMNSARWYAQWYSECARILRTDGVMWTMTNWRSLPVVLRAADLAGVHIGSVAVWDKRWIGPGGPQGLRSRYELCVLMPMPGWRQLNRSAPDVWEIKSLGGRKPSGHPAEKPMSLLRHVVQLSALPTEALVLDPFVGSGTTLAAAAETGNFVFGIEAEARWADTAVERITKPPTSGATEVELVVS